MKKPIVVTPRPKPDGSDHYLLVCGEGRLTAFRTLGEREIPALVVAASDEDAFIMSLSENIARRQCRPLELLAGVEELRTRGYNAKQIATKTGLAHKYVQGILTLLQQGEQRLVEAVEKGAIPLNAALAIVGAGNDTTAVQAVLQEAYEAGTLRGRRLIDARRLMERRESLGATLARRAPRKMGDVTSSSLVRNYQREVDRQKALVRKAAFTSRSNNSCSRSARCSNSSWTRTSRTCCAPRGWRSCRSSSTSASGPRGGGHDRRLARLQD